MFENPSVLDETSITTISPSPPRSAAGDAGGPACRGDERDRGCERERVRARSARSAFGGRPARARSYRRWVWPAARTVEHVRRACDRARPSGSSLRRSASPAPAPQGRASASGVGRALAPRRAPAFAPRATARGSRPGAWRGRRAFAAARPRRRPARPPRPAAASAPAATGAAGGAAPGTTDGQSAVTTSAAPARPRTPRRGAGTASAASRATARTAARAAVRCRRSPTRAFLSAGRREETCSGSQGTTIRCVPPSAAVRHGERREPEHAACCPSAGGRPGSGIRVRSGCAAA